MGVAVGGALQKKAKDWQKRLPSRSSSSAVVVSSTRDKTPEWAKSGCMFNESENSPMGQLSEAH